MIIHLVCGARPNFIKIAPLYHGLKNEDWVHQVLVHTGQHYDVNMSHIFFEDLGLPNPDICLGVGGGTHAEQTGNILILYEKLLHEHRPDLVVVVGDVNSTMAATIAASKLGVKVGHIEAGLRSFDRRMPEEINRVVTDALADILWTPSRGADENLVREGISQDKIQLVGNIMIDSLEMLRNKIESQSMHAAFGLQARQFGMVTLHRPSNVDDPLVLEKLCAALRDIAREVPLIFPMHPRTRKNMAENNLLAAMMNLKNIWLPEPMSYVRFMNLVFNSLFVITDSGGIQEETSYLGIPCLTVRENTERPITISHGTNQLCGWDDLRMKATQISRNLVRNPCQIELWDGKTANRIITFLREYRDNSH
jgi:UDP-N-acetylglucosamine 2-epimerase (non-hydrolysing)